MRGYARNPRFFRDHARDYKGYLSAGKLVGMRRSPETWRWLPGIPAFIQQWATSPRKIATHEAVRFSAVRGRRVEEEVEGTLTNNGPAGSRMCEE